MPKTLLVALIVLALATGGLWVWIFIQRGRGAAQQLQLQKLGTPQISESKSATSAGSQPPFEPKEGERTSLRSTSEAWKKQNGVWSREDWNSSLGTASLVSSDPNYPWMVAARVEQVGLGENKIKFSFASNCTTQVFDSSGIVCGEMELSVNPEEVSVYYSVWDSDSNNGKIGWKGSLADVQVGDLATIWTTRDGLTDGKGLAGLSVKQ